MNMKDNMQHNQYVGPTILGTQNIAKLLATGQTTQYSGELDDGFYEKGVPKPTAAYLILTTGLQSGSKNIDLPHLISNTGAFVLATQKYTDAGKCGVFKAAGGETIVISGGGLNDGVRVTIAATANDVTFAAGIVNEALPPMTTFAKRGALSNECVFDRNTGLMWARYCSVLQGIAGDGKMPWTGQIYDIFAFCAVCNVASLGGYTDWRIPEINALFSIADFEVTTGYPNAIAFPAFPTNIYHWSSTTDPNEVANAMRLYFRAGLISSTIKTTACITMLVRGCPCPAPLRNKGTDHHGYRKLSDE
jgi:hypothetical protein